MARHIETPSAALAQRLIDEIDAADGYPSVGAKVGPGHHIDLAAAAAWVSDPIGEPPPGVARTWDEPREHPSQAGRWSVTVDNARLAKIVGKRPPGFARAVQAQDAVERGPEWFADSTPPGLSQAPGQSVQRGARAPGQDK